MSLRATTDHIDDYGREHLFEIYDDQWGGSVTALKNTGRGFGRFSHQVLDPKKPWENPIQKGVLELSVWLSSTDLLDDITGGDEQQFYIIHKIDSTQEWAGYIYNDLTTYEENILPFRVTLVAKDFTDLGGKDYLVSSALPDDRETVITTIAYLLNEVGFDIPIKTHTSWIEASISSSQDYLRQIYHETKALREFGRTGDESDTAITVEEALNKLCSTHKLILKQTGGCYWIDQISEYETPTSVQETVYGIDGSLDTAETNIDPTVSANTSNLKVVISGDNRDNSGLPGLKRAKVKFDHRTQVTTIKFPALVELDGTTTSQEFSQFFISDGNQTISFSADADAEFDDTITEANILYEIRVETSTDTYWFDAVDRSWGTSFVSNSVDMTDTYATGGKIGFQAFINVETTEVPAAADGDLVVEVYVARSGATFADFTDYTNLDIDINNAIADENSTSIDYVLTQSGSFSVVEEYEDDWYGDGPIDYSPAALRHGSGDGDTTSDSWGRRGQTADKNFHENQLKEPMDARRGWRRLLSALLKGIYYPHNVLSYDSEYFYYLGGTWDIFTGNWQVELFAINISTGTDTFEDLPKFTDESGSGTGSTSGGGSGGGLDQSTADARYFEESKNLSEGDPSTMRGNLGLGSFALLDNDGSESVSVNDITVNGTDLFTLGEEQALGTGDDVEFARADLSGVLTVQSDKFVVYGFDRIDMRVTDIFVGQSGAGGRFNADDNFILNADADGSGAGRVNLAINGVEYVRLLNNGDFNVRDDLIVDETLTINGTPLFDLGKEQNLSDDATGVSFGDLTLEEANIENGFGSALITIKRTNTTTSGRIGGLIFNDLNDNLLGEISFTADGAEDAGKFEVYTTDADTRSLRFEIDKDGLSRFYNDVTVDENLFVEGGLFAKEFTVDTTRVMLSRRFGSGGIVGEIVDSTVGSEVIKFVDEDGNAITPFADNDLLLIQQRTGVNSGTIVKSIKRKVVADSQPSNEVSLTTSGVTTGTDVGAISVGDHAVLDGNTTDGTRDGFISVEVLDRDIPGFGFFDGVDDFGGGTEIMRVGGMEPGGTFEYDSDVAGNIGIASKTASGNLQFYLTDGGLRLIADADNYVDFDADNGTFELQAGDGDLEINDSEGMILGYSSPLTIGGSTNTTKVKWNNGTSDVWSVFGSRVLDAGSGIDYDGWFLRKEDDSENYIEARDGIWAESLQTERGLLFQTDTFYFNDSRAGISGEKDVSDDSVQVIGQINTSGMLFLNSEAGMAIFSMETIGTDSISLELGNNTVYASSTISSAPNGTTGTDARINVLLRDDGRVYLNNRAGFERDFVWFVLGNI